MVTKDLIWIKTLRYKFRIADLKLQVFKIQSIHEKNPGLTFCEFLQTGQFVFPDFILLER